MVIRHNGYTCSSSDAKPVCPVCRQAGDRHGFDWLRLVANHFILGRVRSIPICPASRFEKLVKLKFLFWWLEAAATPVLIPNTEVKCRTTDDTLYGESR